MTAPRLSDLPPPPQGRTGWPWTAESRRLPLTTASGRPWPRISIVTPSFNQGRFIEQTIRSVLLQGYPNLEYVVMDGGSRDESLRAIRRYEAWIDHVASEPDRGQYDALNRGFHRCTGGVMGWLNSDDFYLPDALWAVGGAFADLGDVQWLVGTSSFAGEDGVACNPCNLRPVDTVCIRAGLHDGRVSPWVKQESTFWRRELWEAVGGRLDDAMRAAGDFDLWLRMSRHAELCFLRHPVGVFRVHPDQKTATIMDVYYSEVESAIRKQAKASLTRRLARIGLGRRLLARWSRLHTHCGIIEMDSRARQWKILTD